MEEQEGIVRKLFEGNRDNVPSPRQAGMGVSDRSFGLKAARPQPVVCQGEAPTAMIVLTVLDLHRPAVLQDRAVLRYLIWNAGKELSQVQRRVRVVTHAEQEHLAVQIMHSPHWALGDVGWKRERI
jgi:hypothetical protein